MVYSVTIIGFSASVIYICLVPEVKLTKLSLHYDEKF